MIKRRYELLYRAWNEDQCEYEFTGETEEAETYKDAISRAKELTRDGQVEAVSVECYEVDTRCYEDVSEVEEALYDLFHRRWTERFINGEQYPAVWIGSRPVWRWDFLGRDLRPKRRSA